MNFGEILTKAWKVIWRYKILWVFGILTSCGQGTNGGNGGGGNTGVQFSGGDVDLPPGIWNFFNNLETFFENIQGWQIATLIIGTMLLVLILAFIFTALSTIGRVGLIQGTVRGKDTVENEPAVGMTFGDLFRDGRPYFWRIFWFNILAGIAVFILVLLLIIPLIAFVVMTFGIGLLCLVPLICVLIPAGWLTSVLFEQANMAIVVEDLSMIDGLKRGWEVLRDNIGNLIIMGLILLIGGIVIGVVLALPMIVVFLPLGLGFLGGTTSASDALFSGGIITSVLCCVAYMPFLIVLNGILQAFTKSAWTLTYLQITGFDLSSNQLLDEVIPDEDIPEDDISKGSE